MKLGNLVLFLGLGLILLFTACGEDEISPDFDRLGYSYFPVEVGTWRTYSVNQSIFRIIGDTLVESFQLREEIVDSFLNAENDTTYVLHRSRLDTVSGQYVLDSVWSVRRNSNQAIIVENNIPFIKLGFPIREGLEWNGNSLNTLDEETYTMELDYMFFGETDTIENAIRVIHSDIQDTIIRFDTRSEVFALNVGMVQKSTRILNYCSEVDCLGQGIVESGLLYETSLLDYGPK